ncbi:MAG TPA: archease [Candidatus Nanoarchaeia archaeon]|nr:archease [Candidatus Nanoarchaeia archaeon]
MAKKYRFFDDIATADAAFEAYGKDLPELFTNSALATFSVMAELKRVAPKIKKEIALQNPSTDGLLFDFIQELIYLKDADYMLFSKFTVQIAGGNLAATAYGEHINPKKHQLLTDVKAMTLHMYSVQRTKSGWKAFIILDT